MLTISSSEYHQIYHSDLFRASRVSFMLKVKAEESEHSIRFRTIANNPQELSET
jgi:hypothetical protein